MEDIIQLKIALKWSNPPIWRRVLVNKKSTFFDLHNIIQLVMGWENCHLYKFTINHYRIGVPDEGFGEMFFSRSKVLDAKTIMLGSKIVEPKMKFEYEYDFGDSWVHQITVEKFLPIDINVKYPHCTGGKLNCPPEDCGGIGGYYGLLEVLNDKQHPDREDAIDWLGSEYDPDYFSVDFANKKLSLLH